jgi:hypothetical protein
MEEALDLSSDRLLMMMMMIMIIIIIIITTTKTTTEHKAPCYAVFSTPLLPHPSRAQISSSALYSRKPSAYIPRSM